MIRFMFSPWSRWLPYSDWRIKLRCVGLWWYPSYIHVISLKLMPNVSFWLALPRLFSLHKICNLLLCCFCESTFLFMPREFRCLQGRFRGLCFWDCRLMVGFTWNCLCPRMLCYAMLLTRLFRLDICMYSFMPHLFTLKSLFVIVYQVQSHCQHVS